MSSPRIAITVYGHDELLAAFLERIPVLELNGAIIGELEIDADQIREAIVAAVSIGSHEHDD